jgi:transposase
MSKTVRPWDVDQAWLLPPSIDDFVPAGHPAHLGRDLVRETRDLGAVMAAYDEPRGNPPYHPAMMVALLLHAYRQGVYSSRRIARALEERLDFMAVSAPQRPDFRTISDFRKRHLEALAGLFGQVLRLCRAAGLVELGHVALDGTKLKANASKHKAMSSRRMVVSHRVRARPSAARELDRPAARPRRRLSRLPASPTAVCAPVALKRARAPRPLAFAACPARRWSSSRPTCSLSPATEPDRGTDCAPAPPICTYP